MGRRLVAGLVLTAALLGACGGGDDDPSSAASTDESTTTNAPSETTSTPSVPYVIVTHESGAADGADGSFAAATENFTVVCNAGGFNVSFAANGLRYYFTAVKGTGVQMTMNEQGVANSESTWFAGEASDVTFDVGVGGAFDVMLAPIPPKDGKNVFGVAVTPIANPAGVATQVFRAKAEVKCPSTTTTTRDPNTPLPTTPPKLAP